MIMLKTINSAAPPFSQTLPEATLIITLLLLLKRFAYREIVPLIKNKTKHTRTSIVHHPVAVGSKAARGSAESSSVRSWGGKRRLVHPLPPGAGRLWLCRGGW